MTCRFQYSTAVLTIGGNENGHFETEIIKNNQCPCPDVTSPMIPSQREIIPLSSTGDAQKFRSSKCSTRILIFKSKGTYRGKTGLSPRKKLSESSCFPGMIQSLPLGLLDSSIWNSKEKHVTGSKYTISNSSLILPHQGDKTNLLARSSYQKKTVPMFLSRVYA